MKRIEAFLQPHRVSKVVAALHGLPRFPGFTVLEPTGRATGVGMAGTMSTLRSTVFGTASTAC